MGANLRAVLDDLGIKSVDDIPDWAEQEVLKMVRARKPKWGWAEILEQNPMVQGVLWKGSKKLNDFADATMVNKQPIKVYRGEGKWIGNSTFVKWKYFADSKEFASAFGDVAEWEIPAGSKIFDFDAIKNNKGQTIIPEQMLVDPESLTQYLIEKWYTATKNTNSRWVEYVLLNTDEGKLIELARKSSSLADFKNKLYQDSNLAMPRQMLSMRINKNIPPSAPAYMDVANYIWKEAQKVKIP